jgi:hypothetical protein
VAGIFAEVLPLAVEAVFIRGSELNAWKDSRAGTSRGGTLVRAREVAASREAMLSIVRAGSSSFNNRFKILELSTGKAAGEMVQMPL